MSIKQKKFILIAEDDQFYANIYKVKLAQAGYVVVVVGNGEWLLRACKKQTPDLIILDLVMPIKDGFETLKELKASSAFKHIKILVLTNLGQEEDAQKAKNLGADDYVVKTNISIDKVVDKINRMVS